MGTDTPTPANADDLAEYARRDAAAVARIRREAETTDADRAALDAIVAAMMTEPVTADAGKTAGAIETLGELVALVLKQPAAAYFREDYGSDAGKVTAAAFTKNVLAAVKVQDDGAAKKASKEKAAEAVSAAGLVRRIREDYSLCRSTEGQVLAVPTYAGALRYGQEVKSLRGEVTRRLHTEAGLVPPPASLSAALETVQAYAADSPIQPAWLRAAQDGRERIVIDLADGTGRVVVVTAEGWNVQTADDSSPLFKRSQSPLPEPVRGGSLDTLRELLSLDPDDSRWLLVRGWLVSVVFASHARPLLWATGPQGSGKSTRARMIVSVVEPTEEMGSDPGRNERDDTVAARGRFLVTYDNLSDVSVATSDWLCRLVTGVAVDRRGLYTDDEMRTLTVRRSGVATSRTVPGRLGSDALERIMLVPFARIPDAGEPGERRQSERLLWEAWHAAHPAMLGALLDDVAGVLRHLADVQADETAQQRRWNLPRMADHAQVLAALDLALGLPDDAGHFAAYVAAAQEAMTTRAQGDPFVGALLHYLAESGGQYHGPSEGLIAALTKLRPDDAPWWPSSARKLADQLDKSHEELRHVGITYQHKRTSSARLLTVTGPTHGTDAGTAAADAAPW